MNKIEVCLGPMCASSGGKELLDFLKNHALNGITFEASGCDCTGASAEAPVVYINSDQLGEISIEELEDEINNL